MKKEITKQKKEVETKGSDRLVNALEALVSVGKKMVELREKELKSAGLM